MQREQEDKKLINRLSEISSKQALKIRDLTAQVKTLNLAIARRNRKIEFWRKKAGAAAIQDAI